MVNRHSNVFPGILGRVCDRPCEPACRRGRVEAKPVAICRLKRVAADQPRRHHRQAAADTQAQERQAHRLHRRRLRLADGRQRPDAARLRGHHLRAVRRARRPDAHQHPLLPPAARRARGGDRHDHRHGRGPEARPSHREHARAARERRLRCGVRRLRCAARARNSTCPGARRASANCTSASPGWSRWPSGTSTRSASACSSSVSATRRWTAAAPACGSAPSSVKVMARKPRGFFKASDWELEDAEEESVEIVVNRSPKAFVIEKRPPRRHDVRLHGIRPRRARPHHRGAVMGEEFLPADDVILAIGQENAFPWIEARPRHRVRQVARAEGRPDHLPIDPARRVLRRRCGVRPEEHHLGGGARPPGRDLHSPALPGRADHRAPGRRASTCRAARWACTSGRTPTTTRRSSGG